MSIQSYQDLIVWQKAMDLVEEIYTMSKEFPREEVYSFTSQIRRAAVSIPSNIAEGRNRNSKADYLHFIAIAQGSVAETETQLLIAIRLKYISKERANHGLLLLQEIGKMLLALRRNMN